MNPINKALFSAALLSSIASDALAQSRPPAALETYSESDRAYVIFNEARPEFKAINPDSRRLPKYKIPLDPPQVNLQSRDEVMAMYHGSFGMQAKWAATWNGSTVDCIAGTTKRSYQESVAARTNWWRAMVGRPNSLSYKIDPEQTKYSQAAAMVIKENAIPGHTIPPTARCFSDDAQRGGWSSNLGGDLGGDAVHVDEFFRDSGNYDAAHRTNLLGTTSRLIGAGTTAGGLDRLGTNGGATGTLGTRQTVGITRPDPVIAWPAAGFTFRHHIPQIWSYSNQSLFTATSADVTLSRDGQSIPVTVTHRDGYEFYNDATVVFTIPYSEFSNALYPINSGAEDRTYTVTISNLTGFDGKPVDVSYTVTAINAFPGYADWNGDQSASAVSEYYWPDRDTYFISVARSDADIVDEIVPQYYRTWRGFYAWDNQATALAADPKAVPVCRWFFKAPISSHFYSANQSDCDALKAIYATKPEIAEQDTANAFYIVPASAAGTCDSKYQPVHRLFNEQVNTGKPANHRYTAHPDDIRKMVVLGWRDEGVVFCAPRKREMYAYRPDWGWY